MDGSLLSVFHVLARMRKLQFHKIDECEGFRALTSGLHCSMIKASNPVV